MQYRQGDPPSQPLQALQDGGGKEDGSHFWKPCFLHCLIRSLANFGSSALCTFRAVVLKLSCTSESPWTGSKVFKTQIAMPHIEFLTWWVWVGHRNLLFWQYLRWHWCWWSGDHTLRTIALGATAAPVSQGPLVVVAAGDKRFCGITSDTLGFLCLAKHLESPRCSIRNDENTVDQPTLGLEFRWPYRERVWGWILQAGPPRMNTAPLKEQEYKRWDILIF